VARQEVGALTIQVGAARADVLVDGVLVGQAPLGDEVFVEAGSHTVEAKLAGYEDGKQTVTVAKGEAQAVTVGMTAVVVAPRSTVIVPPPIDARDGISPRKALLIAGGVTTGAALVAGVALTLVANTKASDAATAYTSVVAQHGGMACAQASAPGCSDPHSLIGQKSAFGSAAAWSFIGGGVVGAGTLIYALVAARSAPPAVQVAPVVTGQQGGLVVRGAW
jgi:hypothetical protein